MRLRWYKLPLNTACLDVVGALYRKNMVEKVLGSKVWEELVRCPSGGTESSTWAEVEREWKRLEGLEEGLGEGRICFPFSLSFCFALFTAFLHVMVGNFSAFMQTSMCVVSFCLYGFAKGGAVQKASQ